MRLEDLAVVVLQKVGAVAVQHAGTARRQRRGMAPGLDPLARGLDADELDVRVREVRMEDAHRVAAAADARDHDVGLAAGVARHLLEALAADHALEVAHHHRVRVRARDGADDVERRLDVGDPVAHRLVERVLQRLRARLDRNDLRAEQLHPVDVLHLAAHVLAAM
jgi:hypothetical protein